MGREAIVSSAHPAASMAGVDVLRSGGNAVDAAVAVNAALAVTQPGMCGVGGDLFCLVYMRKEGRVRFLNAGGAAPRAASIEAYRTLGIDKIPGQKSGLAVTLPGCVKGWASLLERYGSRRLVDVMAPAIDLAEGGFPVTSQYASTAGLEPGDVWRQPEMAGTLRTIAEGGADAFYTGDIGRAVVQTVRETGGLMTEEDMAGVSVDWGDPISVNYHDWTVYETPPNTQGISALMMLNLIEGFPVSAWGPLSPDYLHCLVEAKKLAFADTDAHVTDPKDRRIPVEWMLSKERAARRRTLIKLDRAAPAVAPDPMSDTTYFAVGDREGNLVSCVQSLFGHFGTGIRVPGYGFWLQNRGSFFSLDPDHPNCLRPGKLTLHTLMASMVFKNGAPQIVFGTMGGRGQPQTHVQFFANVLHFGMDIQAAIDWPRVIHGVTGAGASDVLHVDDRVPQRVLADLERRGHEISVLPSGSGVFGHAHGFALHRSGAYLGGADGRGDGYVIAW